MAAVRVRPIAAADARAARRLADDAAGDAPHAAHWRWALDAALDGRTGDASALVAVDARDEVVGLVTFGPVGGAEGAARVLGFLVADGAPPGDAETALCDAMVAALARSGTRLVVAELPGDPEAAPDRERLARCGFREDARVPDYFRDGVPLVILRRDLARA